MASDVGQLIVEIKANNEKFEAALRSIEGRLGSFESNVNSRLTRISATFDSLGGAVGRVQSTIAQIASVAALGGLTALAKGALEAGDNIADMAKRLNISSDALQQLQFAFSQSGSSAEAFTLGFQNLNKNVGDALAGIGRARAVFQGLGIDVNKFAKDLAADPLKALAQFADRIKAIPNPAQQAAASLRLVGDPTWIGVLKEGGAALLDTAGKATILSKEATAAADDINDKFNAATDAIKIQFQEALIGLGPTLLKTAQGIAGVTLEVSNLINKFFGLSEAGVKGALEEVRTEIEKTKLALQSASGTPSLFSKDGLKQLGSTLLGGGEAGLLPLPQNELLKKQLADLELQAAGLTKRLGEMQDAHKKTGDAAQAAAGGLLNFKNTAEKEESAAKKQAEAAAKFNAELAAKTVIYKQVVAGTITLGEAEKKLAELQLVSQKGTIAQAKSFEEAKLAAEDYSKTIDLITKLNAEKAKIDIEDNKANVESLRALQEEGLALQEEGRLLSASLGPKAAILDIEKEIALARIERTRQTALTTAKEHELTAAEEEQINTNAELAKSLALATDAQKRQAEALKNSLLSTSDVSNAFKGLATGFFQGTRNLSSLVGDFGKGLAITMFDKFIQQKLFSLDQPLINNVSGLMGQGGILSNIFSAGGDLLGSLFGSGAADAAVGSFQAGWNGIFNGTGAGSVLSSATSVGASFGQTFGQIAGPIGVSIFLGQLTAGLFKGDSANLGARIGGFLGPLGAIVGGLFGGLFDHIPTKGTQIRKSVVNFLKDIEVTFADELKSKNYFFKETKQLAEQMFGGDFLAASKQILNDKVGPELGNQLKALGAFITADQAAKLGKSVEQSGATFGNLLVANLGVDAIPEAISEIVQKSGITLDALVKKLNDLFIAKDIGVDFFKETIQGAVEIFSSALPEAIGVSKIALKSFAEDGTFELEKFKAAVEAATGQFDVAVQTFLDSVNNSKPGEEAARAFGEGLERGLAQLARDQFLKNFVEKELFKGIDFSDGLDSSELDVLKQRTHDASIEADRLSKSLGNVEDAADGVSIKIKELNDQLRELSSKRVQVQIDLAGQLGSIGALTPTQVIATREQPLIPTVDRALNAKGPIGTQPFATFSDDELQAANDALKEMGDLAVERFNAEAAAQNNALRDRIESINTTTQNTINAINQQTQATQGGIRAEFDAKRAAGQRVIDGLQKQKDIQSRVFQDQINGLQKALQVAQQFKQVSQSIQQTINSLTLSNSPLFRPERLAFLQRQAGELRGDKSAEAIEKLSQNLASQLQVGQEFLSPEEFAAQFTSVINELQTLRDATGQQGDKAEDIQRNIEALQERQVAALARIDTQIEAQQKYLQSLSTNENNAIAAAQKAGAARITAAQESAATRIAAAQAETKAAIDAYRAVIVARLNVLAAARDEILKEQAFRLTQQADLNAEQLKQLVDININTQTMKGLLASFLSGNVNTSITPAATGFQGIVDRPRLFLAGEAGRESVSITPLNSNGSGNNSVTFAPSIHVTMQGSTNPEQDGARLGKALSDAMMREYQTGGLGRAIRDDMRRRG